MDIYTGAIKTLALGLVTGFAAKRLGSPEWTVLFFYSAIGAALLVGIVIEKEKRFYRGRGGVPRSDREIAAVNIQETIAFLTGFLNAGLFS